MRSRANAVDEAVAAPVRRSPAAPPEHRLLVLQRAVGNQAVAELVTSVQRCGGETHPGCPCAEEAR